MNQMGARPDGGPCCPARDRDAAGAWQRRRRRRRGARLAPFRLLLRRVRGPWLMWWAVRGPLTPGRGTRRPPRRRLRPRAAPRRCARGRRRGRTPAHPSRGPTGSQARPRGTVASFSVRRIDRGGPHKTRSRNVAAASAAARGCASFLEVTGRTNKRQRLLQQASPATRCPTFTPTQHYVGDDR